VSVIRFFSSIVVVELALAHTAALAKPLSADIELVRPTLSAGAPLGLDGASFDGRGTVRLGLTSQYTRNPLQLELDRGPDQSVVANRLGTQLGFSYDAARRFGIRGSLPILTQWGSDSRSYGSDGIGVGDLSGGVRVGVTEFGNFKLGGQADLFLPIGTRGAWMGEEATRGRLGVSAEQAAGPVAILLDVGTLGRFAVETDADLRLGSELQWGAGARYALGTTPVSIQSATIGHIGLAPVLGPGSSGIETLLGVTVESNDNLLVDMGVGHGLSRGVGATDARVFVGATYRRTPTSRQPVPTPAPAPVVRVVEVDVPEDLPELELPPEPDPVDAKIQWEEDERARLVEERIETRLQLEYKAGTEKLIGDSNGTLDEVATILREHPELVHIVIVGHASEDGSYRYNYSLSMRRAMSVFEYLVGVAIHPDRLSVRGMGEVDPKFGAGTEELLAQNRRVEFRIARTLREGEPPPTQADITKLPWNGEER